MKQLDLGIYLEVNDGFTQCDLQILLDKIHEALPELEDVPRIEVNVFDQDGNDADLL